MSQTKTRIRTGLRELFFNLLPSVVFGLVGLLLEEFSRLFANAARYCDHVPRRTTSFIKLPRVASFRRTRKDSPPSSPIVRHGSVVAPTGLSSGSSAGSSAATVLTRREMFEHTSPVSEKSPVKELTDEEDAGVDCAIYSSPRLKDGKSCTSLRDTPSGGRGFVSSLSLQRRANQEQFKDTMELISPRRQSAVSTTGLAVREAKVSTPMNVKTTRGLQRSSTMLPGPLCATNAGAPATAVSPPRGSLVARRISAYEQLVTSARSDQNGDLKIPRPLSRAESPRKIIAPSGLNQVKGGVAEALLEHWNCKEKEDDDGADTSTVIASESRFEDADSDAAPLRGSRSKKQISRPAEIHVDIGSSDSSAAELEESGSFCLDSLPSSSFVAMEKSAQISTSDAPPGAESLQELIPEILPQSASKVSHETIEENVPTTSGVVSRELFPNTEQAVSQDIILDGDDVIDVDSVENYPVTKPMKVNSTTSINTESYSSSPKLPSPQLSPEPSPVPSPAPSPPMPTLPSGRQRNIRTASRASDLLMFSEDPMIGIDDVEGGEQKKKKTLGLNDSGSLVDGTRIDQCAGEDYDSARMIVGPWLKQASAEQTLVRGSTPVTKSSDENSFQRPFRDADSLADRYRPLSVPHKAAPTDGAVFRQASADVTTLRPASIGERQRSGLRMSRSNRPRFHPSRLTAKVSLPAKGSRPGGLQFTERSTSTFDGAFKDWPEYTPSRDDPTAVARRHMSDVSFIGAKARQEDLLPREVFTAVSEDALYGPDAPERFGGTARSRWKRFGLPSTPRDAAGAVRSIIRRRRKPIAQEESYATGLLLSNTSGHRPSEKTGRKSTSTGAGDFSFNIELPQETVYSLLERICPDCGFAIAVRRPIHKMKVAVPCEGAGSPLLLSITLSKAAHRRGTLVAMWRSRDDQSSARWNDIESAGGLIKRNLLGNLEFIEDSFPSLSMLGNGAYSPEPQLYRS